MIKYLKNRKISHFVLVKILTLLLFTGFAYAKEPQEGDKVYVWAKNGTNFRDNPGINSNIISTLPYGTLVEVLSQDKKIPYSFQYFFKDKEDRNSNDNVISFEGYWLKVKINNKIGYIFNKLLLPYPPFSVDLNDESYFINYFRKVFSLNLIEHEYTEKTYNEYGDNFIYPVYTHIYADKNNKNIVNLENKNGFNIDTIYYGGFIKISKMDLEEAILFFTYIMKAEARWGYSYEKNKYFEFCLNGIPNTGIINFLKDGVSFEWAYMPD